MMKIRYVCFLLVVFCYGGCKSSDEKDSLQPNQVKRIGIYDSRSVAVAYSGSETHERLTQQLDDALEEAKLKNDPVLIKQCDDAVWEARKRLHRQGFSTAPVDDILQPIQDKISVIMKEGYLDLLVSKWDKEKLAQYPKAQTVDVTDLLLRELHPSERQLKWAIDIQSKDPIPLDKIDELIEKEMNQ